VNRGTAFLAAAITGLALGACGSDSPGQGPATLGAVPSTSSTQNPSERGARVKPLHAPKPKYSHHAHHARPRIVTQQRSAPSLTCDAWRGASVAAQTALVHSIAGETNLALRVKATTASCINWVTGGQDPTAAWVIKSVASNWTTPVNVNEARLLFVVGRASQGDVLESPVDMSLVADEVSRGLAQAPGSPVRRWFIGLSSPFGGDSAVAAMRSPCYQPTSRPERCNHELRTPQREASSTPA
jgi:hypothetical protein